MNNTDIKNRERTYQNSNKYIDIIVAIQGIVLNIASSAIIDYNEIILTDYRGFIINIELEQYFNMISSEI